MPAHDAQMLKGVLSLLLLRLVADREDYGWSLVLRLRESGITGLSEGTVYPGLARLQAQGLLDAHLVASSSGPARKYYRLTPAGAAEHDRGVETWNVLAGAVDKILNRGDVT